MNDPKQFEKWRYIDNINDYNNIIEEFQKLYEQTPVTNRFTRARILNGIKQSKRDLVKTQAELVFYYIRTVYTLGIGCIKRTIQVL
jgi:hypothetical protein